MSKPARPDPPWRYVVIRVDNETPPTWFAGYSGSHIRTTTDYGSAAQLSLDDARIAVYSTRIDRGGVWGIRRVDGADEVEC